MKQVTLTGNPHSVCVLLQSCILAKSGLHGQGGGSWDWPWGEPHPPGSGAALELLGWLGAPGQGRAAAGGMCVFNCGEQDRAFSLPKRMLQKFEMCHWHRSCERTFVS